MTSSEQNAGFALLRSWYSKGILIRFIFGSVGNSFSISGMVKILSFADGFLRAGNDSIMFVVNFNNAGASFENVVTVDGLVASGLLSREHPESLEIHLKSADRLLLSVPPSEEAARPN